MWLRGFSSLLSPSYFLLISFLSMFCFNLFGRIFFFGQKTGAGCPWVAGLRFSFDETMMNERYYRIQFRFYRDL